tara:strand:- start:321 stop:923 length:603 start_codon:yes stop_codon:yes gene_type:complete
MEKIIAQGAEAIIYKEENNVIKDRVPKTYRLKSLDESIRKRRTKKEIKLLHKASKIINAPTPKETKEGTKFEIPFLNGKKLSEHLDSLKDAGEICNQIGEQIAKLHDAGIIHGDLTTSNMILSNNKVFFIDFGLGYESIKIEDKAVDLHLIKQALEAKHYKFYEEFWRAIKEGYKTSKESEKTLERLKAVESRGRYKKQY